MSAAVRGKVRGSVSLPALREAAVAASSGSAGDAAHLALAASGSATDAVVAGFLAAAGADARVLLGSVGALVSNSGSAVRAFDGRPLQPGKGAPRPRGILEGQKALDASRIAVPRAVPTLQLIHAYGGRSSFSTLAKYGVEAAAGAGARERAKVIRRVGAAGALAFRTEGVVEALLAAGNSVAGGILTEGDLDGVLPADADARTMEGHAQREGALLAAWPWEGDGPTDIDLGWVVGVVVATDGRGGAAALTYAHPPDGVVLPSVELSAPRVAVPVRRGITRVSPGAPLRAPGPIGIARFGRDMLLAFGLAGAWQPAGKALFAEPLSAAALLPLAEGAAVETALAELVRTSGAERAVAATRTPNSARSVVVVS